MGQETLEAVVRWQNAYHNGSALEITFHGGEPLVPGAPFYRKALPYLRQGLAARELRFGIQSNLWLLTDALCELFREHRVSIGTSLDGPEAINDAQRGEGYFRRTMAGIERARKYGLAVGCICTFTPRSVPHAVEVMDFFVREGLSFGIHGALPSLQQPAVREWMLSPEAYGDLLMEMLDHYLLSLDKVRISTLDAMCRSLSAREAGVCTFGNCLGEYLAVGPQGGIYPCQRFLPVPTYRLGNVYDCPSREMLSASPVWRAFQDRQERITEECEGCSFLDSCRGGCPYSVLAANGGSFGRTLRDPYCSAYRRVFSDITDRAIAEVFSEENLAAVVAERPAEQGLMRRGKLLQIMRGGPHPHRVAQGARRTAAAVALAVSNSPLEAVQKLDRAGLITHPGRAVQSLTALRQHLRSQPQGRVNAYLHTTYACNLACSHCYASSGPHQVGLAMAVDDVINLVAEAAAAGFGKAVITGGEPLVHPQRDALLDGLAGMRQAVKPLLTVIRTNLAVALKPNQLARLAHASDQIVVSVDGDEATHDARRGTGTYALTVTNLRALLAAAPSAEVGITAVLTGEQMRGRASDSVRTVGEELGVRVRFKAVLPLGRGTDLGLSPTFYSSLDDGTAALVYSARLAATCGLGMNLYVGPGGECYPCYALMGARHRLGNAFDDGLGAVLARNDAYRQATVDSNRQCSRCALRYLCGGFCRAWGCGDDPDAPPIDCTALQERARGLLLGALEALTVRAERWLAAGLPCP